MPTNSIEKELDTVRISPNALIQYMRKEPFYVLKKYIKDLMKLVCDDISEVEKQSICKKVVLDYFNLQDKEYEVNLEVMFSKLKKDKK